MKRNPRRLSACLVALAIGGPLMAIAVQNEPYSDARDVYAALATQPHTRMVMGGGQIDVVFADGAPGLDRDRVMRWVTTSAQALITYFGRFPVAHVGLLVETNDGAKIGSGTTYGFDGSAIHINVGRDAQDPVFKSDWVLVHEMTHLALPDVPPQSLWLLEGNATFVEPIARAQACQLAPAEVWRWSVEGLPKGMPRPGDRGLDHMSTWGRTYWGGALFWLLADIRIRDQTHNRLGVQDALKAINRRSGGNGSHWTVDQVMAAGDEATGTTVLATLYAQMKASPTSTDLNDLFAKLGVSERYGQMEFDDSAPLATVRRLMTAGPSECRSPPG